MSPSAKKPTRRPVKSVPVKSVKAAKAKPANAKSAKAKPAKAKPAKAKPAKAKPAKAKPAKAKPAKANPAKANPSEESPRPTEHDLIRTAPHVSIVIPVYNEEGILQGSVLELREKLRAFGFTYEVLLCENGSRDLTIEIGQQLQAQYPEIQIMSLGEPNYGLAMRMGILAARGTFVVCDEIDLVDTEFYARALALLERTDTDLVVGSKAMVGSNDQRPLFRRTATRVYNGMLRLVCQYGGTDTHGLKAFRRERLLDTVQRCVLDKDVFASEFVIRAHRERKQVVEIPFTVREKRPPSIRLLTRVPHVLKSVARLAITVRRGA